jgi:hypothetical protein
MLRRAFLAMLSGSVAAATASCVAPTDDRFLYAHEPSPWSDGDRFGTTWGWPRRGWDDDGSWRWRGRRRSHRRSRWDHDDAERRDRHPRDSDRPPGGSRPENQKRLVYPPCGLLATTGQMAVDTLLLSRRNEEHPAAPVTDLPPDHERHRPPACGEKRAALSRANIGAAGYWPARAIRWKASTSPGSGAWPVKLRRYSSV